jgi:tetratricopeptide (TPR) repeat protein
VPDCAWVGLWTHGTVAFHVLGRFEEELAAAREGLADWPNHIGLMDRELRAFVGMGRLDAVDSVLAVMATLPPQDAWDPALRPVWAAVELQSHGYEAEAEALMQDAIDRFSARTNASNPDWGLGRTHYYARGWSDAEVHFRMVAPEVAERPDFMWYYGVTLAKLGDVDGARAMIEAAGRLDRSNLRGRHIFAQAMITAALGERDEAIQLFQEAFANGAYHGMWVHLDPAVDDLRGYPPFESLVRPR